MSIRKVNLLEFLTGSNAQSDCTLPYVHSTQAANIIDIINERKILATPCNVFTGEKLCYLFVGRPAYKWTTDTEPSEWQLPLVFVLRFATPPTFKRIYPFDSGAFSRRILPEFITMFSRDGYELSSDTGNIGRLISIFFKTPERYLKRKSAGLEEIKEQHVLGARHHAIQALARLFTEKSSATFDDRAAAIEVQIESDVPLYKDSLLGIVAPDETARDRDVWPVLRTLTDNVETYSVWPLSTAAYQAAAYEAVLRIYQKTGVL